MPILDYTKEYENARANLLNDSGITKINKKYLVGFLDNYKNLRGINKGLSVSDSRKQLFCRHIKYFLVESKDIMEEMHNKKVINNIFSKLEKRLNRSTYATCVDVSIRFVKQLYDTENEKPPGFVNIDYLKTQKKMDSFRSEDLLTWSDIKKMIDFSKSIQMKAILSILIDSGLRPSEFIDLKYKDIRRIKNSLVADVTGKTGRREVVLWKSIKYVNMWLDNHPSKKLNDPLWIQENQSEKIKKYRYEAIKKRIKQTALKCKIYRPGTKELKHLYGYAFRHACAKIYKSENVAVDWAASNLGHSVEFYTNVYGKEDTRDRVARSERHQGIENNSEKKENQNQICVFCDANNNSDDEYCYKCNNPLNMKVAMESTKEMKRLQDEVKELKEMIKLSLETSIKRHKKESELISKDSNHKKLIAALNEKNKDVHITT